MGARDEAESWAATVRELGEKRSLRYDPVGGLNPRDAPPALCVGGNNRLTGELAPGYWGASCDADERRTGRAFRRKAVLPEAVLAKAHMPDLAAVVPSFNVESIESRPDERIRQRVARKVEFESLEFNRRFLATVPREYDPVALRELFSPGFLEFATGIERECDFGVSERQLWFLWRMRERSGDELAAALDGAGELFRRVRREMEEHGVATYPVGPWHAGLEPFPEGAQSS
jgi:hypothetical protein